MWPSLTVSNCKRYQFAREWTLIVSVSNFLYSEKLAKGVYLRNMEGFRVKHCRIVETKKVMIDCKDWVMKDFAIYLFISAASFCHWSLWRIISFYLKCWTVKGFHLNCIRCSLLTYHRRMAMLGRSLGKLIRYILWPRDSLALTSLTMFCDWYIEYLGMIKLFARECCSPHTVYCIRRRMKRQCSRFWFCYFCCLTPNPTT